MFIYAVTAVESGTRALQYLGLDGERASVGFNVRNKFGLLCSYVYFFFFKLCWVAKKVWERRRKERKVLGPFSFSWSSQKLNQTFKFSSLY